MNTARICEAKFEILGIGILSFPESRDFFKENSAVREDGAFPDITLCIRTVCGEECLANYSLKSLELWF